MSNTASTLLYIIVFEIGILFMRQYEIGTKRCGIAITRIDENGHMRIHLKQLLLLIGAIVPPLIIYAFRYNVGTDFANYEYRISNMINHPVSLMTELKTSSSTEVGFRIIIGFFALTKNPVIVWGGIYLIPMVLIIHTIRTQYSECQLWLAYAVFLYLHFGSMENIIRQYIAVAIVFYNMKNIYSNRFFKFLLLTILAFSIHRSAIVAMILYFLWDHKKNKFVDIWIIGPLTIGLCFVVFAWQSVLRSVMQFVPAFRKYAYLLIGNTGRNRDLILKIFYVVIVVVLYRVLKTKDYRMTFYMYLVFLTMLIGVTGYYTTFLKRASLYFELPFVIILSYIPQCVTFGGKKMMSILVHLGVILFFIANYLVLGHSEIIPYQWR